MTRRERFRSGNSEGEKMSDYRIETKCIQSGYHPGNGEARVLPIYQSTTFKYETADEMGKLFDLEESGYF